MFTATYDSAGQLQYPTSNGASTPCTCTGENERGCASQACKNCGPKLDQRMMAAAWTGATSALIIRDLNRTVPVGFPLQDIAAGATVPYNIETNFTSNLQIFWAHIDPAVASDLVMRDLKVGRHLIFGSEEPVSCTLFTARYLQPGALGGWPSDVISNSVKCSFTLQNKGLVDIAQLGGSLLARTCSGVG